MLAVLVGGCATGVVVDPAAHMGEHFIAGIDLQTAIIRGDLYEARKHAEWLADHEEPEQIPQAEASLRGVHQASRAVLEAPGLPEAAAATAQVAYFCGDCHAALRSGPEMAPGAPPEPGSGAQRSMFGHIWAADRMWEGLVARSDRSWEAGAETLGRSTLFPRDVVSDSARVAALETVVRRVTGIAGEAQRASDWAGRAEVYGRLLATCSVCHSHLGIDPLGLPATP